MKKLMILGASILQLPAILKAKAMGLQTIALDMDKNAIGFKYADICLEISTIDIVKVVRAARKYKVNGVITLASDMPMRSVAAVAKELDIVGVSMDTAIQTTNKALMRECLKNNNVPIPIFYRVKDYEEYSNAALRFLNKFIVKPIDNSGSRGVFLVQNINDKETVDYAFEYSRRNSRCGDIVLEEYMEGPEVSGEALIVDGNVNIIAITDKLTTGVPKFVEMGHSQPSHFSNKTKEQIEVVTTAAVKALGIENGPSHTEIIVTDMGPKIVELGARLGGDNITTHLVPLSTGVDMVECSIKIALGSKPNMERKFNKGAAIRYFEVPAGKIVSFNGIEEAEHLLGIKEVRFMKDIGDHVGEINSSLDRIGYVIGQAENAECAIKVCEEAIGRVTINVKE